MIKRRLFRINKYMDDRVVVAARHYRMSINQMYLELVSIGLSELDKKDLSTKQVRNK